MINYKIHFIRHGFCEENKNHICVDLNQNPHICLESIEEIRGYMDNYDYPYVSKVYSSPLFRCLETAELIYKDSMIHKIDGLADMDMGIFSGRSFLELQNDSSYISWISDIENTPNNGEIFEDFKIRVNNAFNLIIEDILKNKITSSAIITHSMVLMHIMSNFGLPKANPFYWNFGYAKGVEVFLNTMIWGRDNLFEISGIVPYGMDSFN